MKIPYTIPKVILRAFTRKLDEEALKKSYEGRLLISEDAVWDDELAPTLSQQCLNLVIDEFVFFDKLLEHFNELKIQEYEKKRVQWEKDLAEYIEKKAIYDRRVRDFEQSLVNGDDPNLNFDDDFDDDFDDHDQDGDAFKVRRKPVEPEKVEDEFPEYVPVTSILDHLRDDDRIQVVQEIDLDLVPFPLAVKIIPDDYYWERQARDRWKVFDINDHNKSWRRLYMEKHAWDAIERFHPADDDFDLLTEDLKLVGPDVIRLHIQNVIPICYGTPAKDVIAQSFDADNEFGVDPEFDQGFGDDVMFDDPDDQSLELTEETVKSLSPKKGKKQQASNSSEKKSNVTEADFIIPPSKRNPDMDRRDSSHLDFSLILPIFSSLKEMTIIFEMVETGMDWEERYFRFTDTDCLNLAKAIALTPTLEKFEILRSRVSGEQCKTLVREGLIKLPHLKILNLNYNRIGDDGARAVARLLIDEGSRAPHTIHTVRVARNRIHNKGGKALAFALTRNRHLAIIDARLNSFGDPVGSYFGHALVKNTRLMALFLGANKLTEESAFILGKMLYHNKSLRELDVSSNNLGKKGGEFLALGMRNNKTILRLDVRLCNLGLDFEYDMSLHLRKNRNRLGAANSILDREWYYPPEVESVMLELEEELQEESDDDEEEEEQTGEESLENEQDDEGAGDDEESGSGGIVGGIAAQAFAAAGILGGDNAELALKDPEIVAMLAKAVGVGTGDLKVGALLKNTKKAIQLTESQKQVGTKEPEVKAPKELELKIVKGPQEMKGGSKHALV